MCKLFHSIRWTALIISVLFVAGFAVAAQEKSRLDDTNDSDNGGLIDWIIEANLKREVSFSFRPDIIGVPGAELKSFRIMENQAYLKEHAYLYPYALDADNVELHLNPFSIIFGHITLLDLKVDKPEIQFAVDGRLRTNFDDLIQVQKNNRFSNWVRVHKFIVEDARVNIYSELIFSRYQQYHLSDIDVDIRNIIKGKTADVSIKALTPGSVNQNVSVDGTVGPIVSIARIEESPVDLKILVDDALLNIKEIIRLPVTFI